MSITGHIPWISVQDSWRRRRRKVYSGGGDRRSDDATSVDVEIAVSLFCGGKIFYMKKNRGKFDKPPATRAPWLYLLLYTQTHTKHTNTHERVPFLLSRGVAP